LQFVRRFAAHDFFVGHGEHLPHKRIESCRRSFNVFRFGLHAKNDTAPSTVSPKSLFNLQDRRMRKYFIILPSGEE
jgi:hypothetical protein